MHYRDHLDMQQLGKYASAINTRAKQYGAPGRVDAVTLRSIILESGGQCAWCGVVLVDQPIEIEHIISLKQRGRNTADNLACTCPDCNREKGEQHPAKFAQKISARNSSRTALVELVLAHYEMQALKQQSLFDLGEENSGETFIDKGDADDVPPDEVPPDSIPPYRW